MQLSKVDYYGICLDFKFQKLYIIWISDEIDGVIISEDQKIICFKSENELLKYTKAQAIQLSDDLTYYRIYKLQQWLIEPYHNFDCVQFLNFWNLSTDIAESIQMEFMGDVKGAHRNEIYDKLFDASGVFIAENPNPTFSEEEIRVLAEIMGNGLSLLLDNMFVLE